MRGLGTDDVLKAGAGDDTLIGGPHADVFVLRPGEDHVSVADPESWDTFRFEGFGFTEVSEALDALESYAALGTRFSIWPVEPQQIELF